MRKVADKDWPKCCICGEKKTAGVYGRFYCNKHYQNIRRYGQPYGKGRRSTNIFRLKNDVLEITAKNGTVFLADAEDAEKLQRYSWCVSKSGYAVARIDGRVVRMHRFIMGIDSPDIIIDHKNNNKCDNRKSNLRICSSADNARNKSVSKGCKSGHLGIRKTKEGKFNVRITKDRKEIHVGNYISIEEAVRAREQAENKYHGEFASHKN